MDEFGVSRMLTHLRNAVPLVWGSLRLAPIMGLMTSNSHDFTGCNKKKVPKTSVMVLTRTICRCS